MLSPTLITVAMAATLIGILSGVLGTFLVLKGQSLLGDVISHAALPGIVAGFLISGERGFGAILLGALVSGALAGLTVQLLRRGSGVKADAALGTVLSLYFAAGVVMLSVAQDYPGSAGLDVFLFGQAASVLRADLPLMLGIVVAVLGIVAFFWKEFALIAFDREAARAQGLPVTALETLMTVLIATAIVLGLSLAGVVLMVAMLIAPAVAARQWVRSLLPMALLAAGLGVLSGVAGAVLSALGQGIATGPVMVLIACGVAAASVFLSPHRGLLARWLRQRRLRHSLKRRQVLVALSGLSEDHGDPGYSADKAMLDAYLGADSGPALERLLRDGLIRGAAPMEPETQSSRWELTQAGRTYLDPGKPDT